MKDSLHQMCGVEILSGRNNPDYSQVTGLIPKALAQRFRVYCVENEILLTEASEIAIQEFLDTRQNKSLSPANDPKCSEYATKCNVETRTTHVVVPIILPKWNHKLAKCLRLLYASNASNPYRFYISAKRNENTCAQNQIF